MVSDGITRIGENAFNTCRSLSLTSLPEGIAEIEDNAFWGCAGIELTWLPPGITKIAAGAFGNCINLSLLSLPEGVTEIGPYAFSNCESLSITSLPGGIKKIGERAFSNCPAITSIAYHGGSALESIGTNAFFLDDFYETQVDTDSDVLKEYDWAGDNRARAASPEDNGNNAIIVSANVTSEYKVELPAAIILSRNDENHDYEGVFGYSVTATFLADNEAIVLLPVADFDEETVKGDISPEQMADTFDLVGGKETVTATVKLTDSSYDAGRGTARYLSYGFNRDALDYEGRFDEPCASKINGYGMVTAPWLKGGAYHGTVNFCWKKVVMQ
ncbi:MAG: leucine-rich repeat domain-containing protein [Lachnospiraceae bacterium]|nr:leucine-rich repeat domain-containing protein [Lachnospiraceae bacterium]